MVILNKQFTGVVPKLDQLESRLSKNRKASKTEKLKSVILLISLRTLESLLAAKEIFLPVPLDGNSCMSSRFQLNEKLCS